MTSKILDEDYLVLQRKGAKPIVEPDKPRGGPYDLYYDLETFHYRGADLRYTVEQYNKDSGVFVLVDGSNHMTGNLKIKYPETGNVERGAPARLELTGFKTGFKEYAEVRLINRANNSAGKTQKVAAVNPSDGNYDSFIKLNNNFSVTYDGKVYVGGRHICANDGDGGGTTDGGGFLSYITSSQWNITDNQIKETMDDNIVRLRWNNKGGALKNVNGNDVLKWLDDRVTFRANEGADNIIAEYNKDHFLCHLTPSEDKSITNKEYVDQRDALYVPLAGTLSDAHVTGPVQFDAVAENGYLMGAVGSQLEFRQRVSSSDVKIMSIGGSNGNIDEKIHFHKDVNVHSHQMVNVKYPTNIHTLGIKDSSDTEKSHAVRKEYIDDQDDKLQHQLDSVIGISAPVGMINAYVGDDDPEGWFICDGRSLDDLAAALGRSDLPQLRALVGNNLPELSGAFLAQKKQTRGNRSVNGTEVALPVDKAGGDNVGTSLKTNLPERTGKPFNSDANIQSEPAGGHTHSINFGYIKTKSQWMANNDNNSNADGAELTDPNRSGSRNSKGDVNMSVRGGTFGSAQNHRHNIVIPYDNYTRPQTYTINWIIKYDNG